MKHPEKITRDQLREVAEILGLDYGTLNSVTIEPDAVDVTYIDADVTTGPIATRSYTYTVEG